MYQRHEFGAPPPIYTPPPAPYNPKHRAYATGKQPTSSSEVRTQTVQNTKVPHQDAGGFPAQLSPLLQNKPQPVPANDFSDNNITQSVADLFSKQMKIYVTPTDYSQLSSERSLKSQRSRSQLQSTRDRGLKAPTWVSGNSS